MLNIYRSFMDPCPCAWSRFGWQLSNTAKMPETWNPLANPNPCVYSNNYRGMPIKNHRSCGGQRIIRPSAGQDYLREHKKHKSRRKNAEQEFQDYESHSSQDSFCHCWEQCRCHEQQPPAPPQKCRRQQSSPPPRRCKEQEPPAPQRCCCEQQPPSPPRRCKQQELPAPRRCKEQEPPAPQRCCCDQQPPSPPRRCCCQDIPRSNCQDKVASECREKRRRKRRSCRRRKCCSCESMCVVTHEMGVQTEGEPPCKPDRVEIIDITTQEKEVRHRNGEVEILVDEIQTVTVVPNDGSKPTKSHVESHVSSNADEPQGARTQFQEEIDPSAIEVPDKALRYSRLEPILANLQDIPPNPPSGYSSPSESRERRVYRTNEKFEKENEFKSGKQETQTVLDNPNDVRESQPTPTAAASSQPVKQRFPNPTFAAALSQPIEPPPLQMQERTSSSLNRVASGYSANKNFKDNIKGITAKPRNSRMVENSEGKLVPKPRASDFSQVSTVHMKVTNRKEKLSQKAGRKSVHQDAVFETKISELRLISPVSEEVEEEPKPKPKRKKPKKVPKLGCPPPNDLVCRMNRPIQRKKCEPQMCRTGCRTGCGAAGRSCGLPCTVRCSGSPYPPCVPRNTQCDPIYGFGSHPAAYYCHR